MNLQYITNTEPPPAQSVLQYSVNPDTVFVSTATQQMYANLTITVFNPSTEAVTCQMFHFGFYVGAEYGDLTAQTTGIQTSSGQTSLDISKEAIADPDAPSLYYYAAPPSGTAGLVLEPNQSLTFNINGVLINRSVGGGGAPLVIKEVTGANLNNLTIVEGEITITKKEPTLSAQLSVIPPTPVSPGDAIKVSWQVTGSNHWQLYDTKTDALLYDSQKSSPPNADSYTDHPNQNTTYELIVWAGQLFTAQQAAAMVSAPTLSVSPPSVTVDPLTDVTIDWTANYAQTVTINPPPASGPATVDATKGQGSFVVRAAQTTTYTLYATGHNNIQSKQRYVIVNINPVRIDSFTIVGTARGAQASWRTPGASAIELVINGVPKNFDPSVTTYESPVNGQTNYTLKAYGPDGPAIQSQSVWPVLALPGAGSSAIGGPFTGTTFGQFTIEVCFWPTQPPAQVQGVVSSKSHKCLLKPGDDIWLFEVDWVENNHNFLVGSSLGPTDTWLIAAAAYDPGGGMLWRYGGRVGGALSPSGGSCSVTFDNTSTLVIGDGLVGYVQWVRLWNVFRTAQQVQASSCGLQPPQPGLVAYFDFSQLPFKDISGHNLPIQLSGNAAPGFHKNPCG